MPDKKVLNGLNLSAADSALSLFYQLRESCPERTCVIAVDGIEWPSAYMDIFRALARLAGIQDSVRRVIAERSSENREEIELVFYCSGEKFQWRFRQTHTYLSEAFWEKACWFFGQRASRNIILISTVDEPFLELISLSSEELATIQHSGLSLSVWVKAAQTAQW